MPPRLRPFLLCLALLWLVPGPLAAQGLQDLLPRTGRPIEPSASAPTAEEWAGRLEAARAAHQALQALPPDSQPLLTQRLLVSARLLLLLAARVEAQKAHSAAPSAADHALLQLPRLNGPPPYSLLAVDALRDRHELLLRQQATLQQVLRQLDQGVDEAVKARAQAEAELRRLRAQGSGPALELAELSAQVAGLEVLQGDEQRARARARLAALDAPLQTLRAEIERGRAQMRLDDADLARLLAGVESARLALGRDTAALTGRVAQLQAQPGVVPPWRQRTLQALQQTLQMQGELEAAERGLESLWRMRHDSLARPPDAPQRQHLVQKIGKALEDLQHQRQRLVDENRLLRLDLRTQQALVAGLAPGSAALAEQQQVLAAQQAQADAQDRLRDAIDRLAALLERARDDLGLGSHPVTVQDWGQRAWGWLSQAASALWQFELFSATETTLVDGREVTVEHEVTVGKSIGMLVMLVAGYLVSGRLSRWAVDLARRRVPISAQLGRVLSRWINSILLLVVLLLVLKLARIPLTAFAFLGGALAIGVGFGAQNVIKNLISGVIILFERKIRVGDVVSIGGMSGTVTTVDLRATTVRGFDGIDAIVPNSSLLENQISNWSGGSPDVRRTVTVGVAYGTDLRLASRLILGCAAANAAVLREPAADVLFEDFGANDLTLRLYYWMRLGGPRSGAGVDSDLRFAIADALAEAGISMAFPQRDVHLDLVQPLQVQIKGGDAPA